jgi:phosphopantetheinyl transferase
MHRSDESKLQEFYLRWAIKEAYTKALGLGMNVEFQSFEMRLMEVDGDTGGIDEGI